VPKEVTWTLGLGYDSYNDESIDVNEVNPKFGVQWHVTDAVRLRAAAMRTVKRALVVNQTLGPTEVAGFNQFFDDPNGTTAQLYGVAVDTQVTRDLYVGFQYLHRDLDVRAKILEGDEVTETAKTNRHENLYSAYAYWAPVSNWVFSTGVLYDDFSSEPSNDPDIPTDVETWMVPITVRYFNSWGIFGQMGPTFVHQDVERVLGSRLPDGDDSFVLVDAALGYRFPKRYGIVSLEVLNLFDQGFKFQDNDFRTNEVRGPLFFPDRTILGRITLSF